MPEHTYLEYVTALETLEHAAMYLEVQYRHEMEHDEAVAHFGARLLLMNTRQRMLREAKTIYAL
jgi:hypothetical protein